MNNITQPVVKLLTADLPFPSCCTLPPPSPLGPSPHTIWEHTVGAHMSETTSKRGCWVLRRSTQTKWMQLVLVAKIKRSLWQSRLDEIRPPKSRNCGTLLIPCLSLSLSNTHIHTHLALENSIPPSLSLTHTHTHTPSLSLTHLSPTVSISYCHPLLLSPPSVYPNRIKRSCVGI